MPNGKSLYNLIPYPGVISPNTRPDHLSLCSLWHNGPRPAVENFRYAEIGCGDGANLLSLAFYHPESVFIGIDNAKAELDRARKEANFLALKNVRFIHKDIRDLEPAELAPCDYIVAHGLYSWVPEEIREAILQFCRQNLTQSGLAYISYNTQPGWAIRRLVRETLLHARPVRKADVNDKPQKAIAFAARLLEDMPSRDYAYTMLLADELERVRNAKPGYVFHEYLTPVNEGFWLSDFVECARRHGLDYVADAQFCRWDGYVPPEIQSALDKRNLDRVEWEEAADLIGDRYFRSSILCREDALRSATAHNNLLDEVNFATSLRAKSDPLELKEGVTVKFMGHSQADVTLEASITKTAVALLAAQWPLAMTLEKVYRKAAGFINTHGRKVPSDALSQLTDDLITLFEAGQIDLRLREPEYHTEILKYPQPHALAQYEAAHRNALTTPYHVTISFEPNVLELIRALDGTYSENELYDLFGDEIVHETTEVLRRWGLLIQMP